jgi:probable selenium-dependent hydroxylase accessory protein YqeC
MKFSQILFQNIADAHKSCVGILGGGGKTALLHVLANELSKTYDHVMISSLTKAGISAQHQVHFFPEFEAEGSREALLKINPLFIMGGQENEYKLLGLEPNQLQLLHEHSDLTLFECDGARKKPIKAHQPFDPAIPHFATHAIIVVGADAVGARVEGKMVHRPELFRELWDVNANQILDPVFIARVLTSEYGYLQKVPKDVKLTYFVNKADTYPDQAFQLARTLSRLSHDSVFYGSIEQGVLKKVN